MISETLDNIPRLEILALITPILLWFLYTRFNWTYVVPTGLPWVGQQEQILSAPRARLRAMSDVNGYLDEGYHKYSEKTHSFIIPSWPMEPSVIVPQSKVSWLMKQRDGVVSMKAAIMDRTQSHWTFMSDYVMEHDTHREVILRYLNKKLGSVVPAIVHELSACFDEYWGVDTENWKDIVVWENMLSIVARTSNSVLNPEVCRNETFLYHDLQVSQNIAINAFLIRIAPPFLRSVFARLLRIPLIYHHYRCSKYLLPIIRKRLADIGRKIRDPEFSYQEPDDFLSWTIRDAFARNHPIDLDPKTITNRMLVMNFAGIHPSSITVTNILFNLFSSPPSAGFVSGLREEASRILSENNGTFTKAGLDQMLRTDSAIKESMRYSSLTSKGLDRTVVAEGGVTMDDGLFLPHGTRVGTSLWSIHHDEKIYPHAHEYDAFRFSRPVEEFQAKQDALLNGVDSDTEEEPQSKPLTQNSDIFLEFGHGRHACPGRFFTSIQLKLLIAYLVLNYDVKPLETRPESTWLADYSIPPRKATLQVCRRKT